MAIGITLMAGAGLAAVLTFFALALSGFGHSGRIKETQDRTNVAFAIEGAAFAVGLPMTIWGAIPRSKPSGVLQSSAPPPSVRVDVGPGSLKLVF